MESVWLEVTKQGGEMLKVEDNKMCCGQVTQNPVGRKGLQMLFQLQWVGEENVV